MEKKHNQDKLWKNALNSFKQSISVYAIQAKKNARTI